MCSAKAENEDIKKFNKLLSDKPKYVQLRQELFPNGINLSRV